MPDLARRRSIATLCGAALALPGALRGQTPTYKVGVTPAGVPFTYLDPSTQTIRGAMADVVRFIGAQAGFAVSFEPAPFGSLIPMLADHRIDLIGAAMLVTEPRRALVDFSDAVFAYPEALAVSVDDTTPYRSLADLKGRVVGAQADTVYAQYLKGFGGFAEIRLYRSIAELLHDVDEGRIAAALGDAPIFAYQLAQSASTRVRRVASYAPQLGAVTAIAVRKGDAELLGKINASLAKLHGDGSLERISARWNLA